MSNLHENFKNPNFSGYKINPELLKKYMSNDYSSSDFEKNYDRFGLRKYHFLTKIKYVDLTNRYKTNSNGFRCRELADTDLLFAGCSVTFGVGIQEEAIWGNQLSKKLGYSAINLSEPGVGVDKIVNYIFSYLKQYKAPKLIVCLFPDFGRMLYPVVTELVSAKNMNNNMINDDMRMHSIQLAQYQSSNKRASFDKKPYEVETTVPYELPFFTSINKIMMLDQYCKSNNINFFWGTWENDLNNVITEYNKIHNIYSNFVSMDNASWICNEYGQEKFILDYKETDIQVDYDFDKIEDFCHKDVKINFASTFYTGLDNEDMDYRKVKPHPGSHKHAHFADSFVKFLTKEEIK